MCAHYVGLVAERVKMLVKQIESMDARELPKYEQQVLELPAAQANPQMYPKSTAPLIVPSFDTAEGVPKLGAGSLTVQTLHWGFDVPWSRGPVFNTRIESADKPVWRKAITHNRCIIPCLKFYETSATETTISPRTGNTIRQPYHFTVAGMPIIFIGAVRRDNEFSMMTTAANTVMAPVHNRMPLILHPTELSMWLGPNYMALADRSRVPLIAGKVQE